MEFGRLITAMVTPFNEQGDIDWIRTASLIDELINVQQSDSIVISGTTGESPTLSDEEKVELFRFAVKHAAGRCQIIAGTGSNNTAHTIHLTKAAESCGVDGVLVVAPYYNKPSQDGLFAHYKAVAEATKLPIMMYNVESRTGINISVETTLRLAAIDNIVATKDCASMNQLTEIVAGAPEGFKVYSGEDSAVLTSLAVGAYGLVSVASHVVGAELKALIQAYLSGDVQTAARLNGELHPILKGLFIAPNPVPVKHALAIKGRPVGGVRLPLVPVNEAEDQFLRKLLS